MSDAGGRTPEQVRGRFRRLKLLAALALFSGFMLNIFGRSIARGLQAGDAKGLAVAVQVGGFLMMLVSGVVYARLKGRSGWWGLIAFLGCIGYLVLVLLDKECLRCGARSKDKADACSSCGAPV